MMKHYLGLSVIYLLISVKYAMKSDFEIVYSISKSLPITPKISLNECKASLTRLSLLDNITKRIDKFAHSLQSTVKNRFTSFVTWTSWTLRNSRAKKEAKKLLGYIVTVERSIQSLEIIESISEKNASLRLFLIDESGLEEVFTKTIQHSNISFVVSVCLPNHQAVLAGKFLKNEVIVIVTSEGTFRDRILPLILQTPQSYKIHSSSGLADDDVYIQPFLFAIAKEVLVALDHAFHILHKPSGDNDTWPSPQSPRDSDDTHRGDSYSRSTSTASPLNTSKDEAKDAATYIPHMLLKDELNDNGVSSVSLTNWARSRMRVMGYSTGGAVAGLVAMILDGSMNISSDALVQRYAGKMRGKVQAMCVAPPPCVSRGVTCGSVTSVVAGDDMMARCTNSTYAMFQKKLMEDIQANNDEKGRRKYGNRMTAHDGNVSVYKRLTSNLQQWRKSKSSLIASSSKQALINIRRYKTIQHDLNSLQLPGNVYYLKYLKGRDSEDVAIQRVLRSNWKEDMLWSLHDIAISPHMVSDHKARHYLQLLSRC